MAPEPQGTGGVPPLLQTAGHEEYHGTNKELTKMYCPSRKRPPTKWRGMAKIFSDASRGTCVPLLNSFWRRCQPQYNRLFCWCLLKPQNATQRCAISCYFSKLLMKRTLQFYNISRNHCHRWLFFKWLNIFWTFCFIFFCILWGVLYNSRC